MLLKIISGGQTGVDRAALDTAIKMGLAHGGFIPRGRKTEDGRLPDTYALVELDSPNYQERTERNVLEAEGTLIVSRGPLDGGSAYTRHMAELHGVPWLHVDLNQINAFQAARQIDAWIADSHIEVLNVAGPRASKDAEIYGITMRLLESVFYMDMMRLSADAPGGFASTWQTGRVLNAPETLSEAVEALNGMLSLRDRHRIALTGEGGLPMVQESLNDVLRRVFRLDRGNQKLLDDCAARLNNPGIDADTAGRVVVRALWEELRRTHMIRRIK
jgi:hypothetical protein